MKQRYSREKRFYRRGRKKVKITPPLTWELLQESRSSTFVNSSKKRKIECEDSILDNRDEAHQITCKECYLLSLGLSKSKKKAEVVKSIQPEDMFTDVYKEDDEQLLPYLSNLSAASLFSKLNLSPLDAEEDPRDLPIQLSSQTLLDGGTIKRETDKKYSRAKLHKVSDYTKSNGGHQMECKKRKTNESCNIRVTEGARNPNMYEFGLFQEDPLGYIQRALSIFPPIPNIDLMSS